VDPRGRRVYLTEDVDDGCLYRFAPRRWPDLSSGTLEVAVVGRRGRVRWRRVPDPSGEEADTRDQVEGATRFARGEGLWFDSEVVYVSTTSDSRVHAYDTRTARMRVIYDGLASARAPLIKVDQMTASPAGEVFVCEDIATREIDMGVIRGPRDVTRFLSVTGPQHDGSELTGVAFAPGGGRMYFASQRAWGAGAIYEVTGPFRRRRVRPA
jgi:secreted PhoX family phosphatase